MGLTNGTLLVYKRNADDGCWQMSAPDSVQLSDSAAVKVLLPLSAQLYAALADTVMVLDCSTLTVVVSTVFFYAFLKFLLKIPFNHIHWNSNCFI